MHETPERMAKPIRSWFRAVRDERGTEHDPRDAGRKFHSSIAIR